MFGKQKLLILSIADLGLTLSGAAFAQSTSPTVGNAVWGSTVPITQFKVHESLHRARNHDDPGRKARQAKACECSHLRVNGPVHAREVHE